MGHHAGNMILSTPSLSSQDPHPLLQLPFSKIAWLFSQAFCSSVTGTLATQAMLKGYGVGDEKATTLAATMTWILRSKMFKWKSNNKNCDGCSCSFFLLI